MEARNAGESPGQETGVLSSAEEVPGVLGAVRLGSGKRWFVNLSNSPFRMAGGGQPGDRGTLAGESFFADVLDSRDEDGNVWLELVCRQGVPREGLPVRARVDLATRHRFSRHHSGEHVLSRVLEDAHPGLTVYKVAVGADSATVYFTYDGEVGWEFLFAAEDRANAVVAANLPITVQEYTRDQARLLPRLKVNWDRVVDASVRVVRIGEDLDIIACSGSHVTATGAIGELLITGFNGAPPEWSFTFTADGRLVGREYLRCFRRMVRTVGCEPDQVEKVFERLQAEKGVLQKTLEKVRHFVALPWEHHEIGSMSLDVALVTAFPADLAAPAVKRRIEENPRGLALVLLPSGTDEKTAFFLACGASVGKDLRRVLKTPELEARGGGAPGWVSGMSRSASVPLWLRAVERVLAREDGA